MELVGGRLVVGRRAADRGGDDAIAQCQSVVDGSAGGLRREASFVQCAIEKPTALVAGEHASGAVRAVRSGSESDDDEPRFLVAKRGNGTAPIGPLAICA